MHVLHDDMAVWLGLQSLLHDKDFQSHFRGEYLHLPVWGVTGGDGHRLHPSQIYLLHGYCFQRCGLDYPLKALFLDP